MDLYVQDRRDGGGRGWGRNSPSNPVGGIRRRRVFLRPCKVSGTGGSPHRGFLCPSGYFPTRVPLSVFWASGLSSVGHRSCFVGRRPERSLVSPCREGSWRGSASGPRVPTFQESPVDHSSRDTTHERSTVPDRAYGRNFSQFLHCVLSRPYHGRRDSRRFSLRSRKDSKFRGPFTLH